MIIMTDLATATPEARRAMAMVVPRGMVLIRAMAMGAPRGMVRIRAMAMVERQVTVRIRATAMVERQGMVAPRVTEALRVMVARRVTAQPRLPMVHREPNPEMPKSCA